MMSPQKLIIDESKCIIFINNDPNLLSKNECLLIKYLYEKQGTVISRDELLHHCWPGRVVSPTSLPVAIKHIRDVFRKIEREEAIKTYKGEGYSFIPGSIKIEFVHRELEHKTIEVKKSKTSNFICKIPIHYMTIIYVISFLFIIGIMFSGNIKSRRTHNGQLVISSRDDIPELDNATTLGNLVFIDETESVLICNHTNCTFTQ
ncbi:winged helix-turn-helix domain-containing protein [Escherichia coli]|uniref:winged helix-turn-helix domain-containing protein n=1 Tax=Escherichia coli TaxID=562 RepID=UPI000BE3FE2A|nr:winged helix-turn-helix domain-containing protein [Escherichia coli]EFA4846643.1 hypothetical protein [Escherichia coli]EIG2139487.1 winged helix-turn-helix domain-containing protein [Escherichia coli]MBS9319404.1 winged helix-turn-helix domain-containing protein [Escherichia coli]